MNILTIRIILSIAFFIGSCVNWIIRAGFAYRSDVNCYPTRTAFYVKNWDVMGARFFWGFLLFYVWMIYPDSIPKAVAFFPIPKWFADWLTVTPNPATAAAAGALLDVLLDAVQSIIAKKNIPWLSAIVRARLPQYDASVVDVSKVQQQNTSTNSTNEPPEF